MQAALELGLLAPESLRLLLQSLGDSDGDGKDGAMLLLWTDVVETAEQRKSLHGPREPLCGAAR